MEDTMQQDWAKEYVERVEEAEQYSAYMKNLAKQQEEIITDIRVLQRLLEDKYIQLKKVESYLL